MYRSGTLTKFSKPDFLCYLQKSLILRGEEKRSPDDLEIARRELIDKFDEWSLMYYAKLPFVFGYATGGLEIQYVLFFSLIIASLNLGLDTLWIYHTQMLTHMLIIYLYDSFAN